MTIGIIILAHKHLHRTRQIARCLASKDCKVVIHVDANTDDAEYASLQKAFRKSPHIAFADRVKCDWGGFSLVAAGLGAANMMLTRWPKLTHIAQISGACIPLQPVDDLSAFLGKNPDTDFAESVPAVDNNWIQSGLGEERFTLYFPFSWKRQRKLFDLSVEVQRRLGIKRKPPAGLVPHLGSQWWCLSANTMRAILNDPDRQVIDRYFSSCWIPDEGYIPTMVQRHSMKLKNRSLTLSRFDDQGKPHLFYDDHEGLLAQEEAFFARKVWHGADRLYRRFTGKVQPSRRAVASKGDDLNSLFHASIERRCKGREGRLNVGRFPAAAHRHQPATCDKYAVFLGLTHLCNGFETWVDRTTGFQGHGRLFKHNEVQFTENRELEVGAVPSNPKIRDLNPEQFLCNVLWNARPKPIALMYDFADGLRMAQFFAHDPNSQIVACSGSWIIDLFQRKLGDRHKILQAARKLQRFEAAFVSELKKTAKRDVQWVSLAEFVTDYKATCINIQKQISPNVDLRPRGLPEPRDLNGLRAFAKLLADNDVDISSLGCLPDVLPGEEGWTYATRANAVS